MNQESQTSFDFETETEGEMLERLRSEYEKVFRGKPDFEIAKTEDLEKALANQNAEWARIMERTQREKQEENDNTYRRKR